jgi:preprotein translocase subunit YajC
LRNFRNIIATISIAFLLTGCPFLEGEGGGGGSSPLAFLPFVLIFVVFYFLILRPQQKQGKLKKQMLKELKRGDDIITSGGIYGKILNISEDDVITLEVVKGMSIRISRSAIAGLQPSAEESKGKEEKSKK